MPLATLFEKNIDEFIAENADRPGDLWLFIHIPKTAGSSFHREMARQLGPTANLHVDYLNQSVPYKQQMDAAIQKFLTADRATPFRFAAGHITAAQAMDIAKARPQTKILTILRHPIDRVVSDYRYQLTSEHPFHKEFKNKFPTIQSFAEAKASQNKMFKRLAPRRPITTPELVEYLERNFTYIGLLENYAKSLSIVSRLIGGRLEAEARVRKTADTDDNKVDITEDLRGLIARLNSRDMAIYNHFRRRLNPAQPAVQKKLQTVE